MHVAMRHAMRQQWGASSQHFVLNQWPKQWGKSASTIWDRKRIPGVPQNPVGLWSTIFRGIAIIFRQSQKEAS